jgi:acyl carrier protein
MSDIVSEADHAIWLAVADALGKVTTQSDRNDRSEARALNPSTRLREDLGLDSFAALELLFELEDLVGVRIPQESAVTFETVGDVVTFIHATLAARGRDTSHAAQATP